MPLCTIEIPKNQTDPSVTLASAVEFDCLPDPNYEILPEARLYAAKTLEQLLNQNPLTSQEAAEIWFRQGQPTLTNFSSAS